MKINHPIQIYRTHDYEIMALCQTGIISVASIAKKALIAYYKGEPYSIRIPAGSVPAEKLPPKRAFRIEIDDSEAPGIVSWFYGIERGYRNNFVKTLIKRALSGEWSTYYRRNGFYKENAGEDTDTGQMKEETDDRDYGYAERQSAEDILSEAESVPIRAGTETFRHVPVTKETNGKTDGYDASEKAGDGYEEITEDADDGTEDEFNAFDQLLAMHDKG